METTRKALRQEAVRLGAIKVSNNIYTFENVRHYIGCEEKDIPADYKSIVNEVIETIKKDYPSMVRFFSACNLCYSAGIYGNNGRLDSVGGYDKDGKRYESLGYIYY